MGLIPSPNRLMNRPVLTFHSKGRLMVKASRGTITQREKDICLSQTLPDPSRTRPVLACRAGISKSQKQVRLHVFASRNASCALHCEHQWPCRISPMIVNAQYLSLTSPQPSNAFKRSPRISSSWWHLIWQENVSVRAAKLFPQKICSSRWNFLVMLFRSIVYMLRFALFSFTDDYSGFGVFVPYVKLHVRAARMAKAVSFQMTLVTHLS